MVKIEKLFDNAKGTFVREGVRMPFFLFQLLSLPEYDTLEITEGSILVSINEEALVRLPSEAVAEAVVTTDKSTESTEPVAPPTETSEVLEETAPVVEKKIIQPAPRKK